MKPTIRDVAQLANVSISTVSRVMNSPESVIDEKRRRVLDAIEQLQYQPNALARGLIYKKSNSLGVFIPDIRNSYYAGMIRGMEDASKTLGYSLLICNTDRDKKQFISYFRSLYEKQIDGILFTSDIVYPDYYEALKSYKFPVVLAATHSLEYELPSVKINDEQAAFDAVQYLIGSGHRKIGMISFALTDTIAGLPRYQGFVRALREYDLEECSGYVEYANHWFEEGCEAAARLLDKYPDLTAVFTSSDELAAGVISYLYENGKSVPQDLSVIGFDNSRISMMVTPKLTTVAQPVYEIGYNAVVKLDELIQHGQVKVLRETLPHSLVIRNSTRSIQ